MKQTAFSFESAMAASEASSASVGEMVPARKASTSAQASSIHGWSLTGENATGNGRRAARRRPYLLGGALAEE